MSSWKWLRAVPFILALGAGVAASARAQGPDPADVRAAAIEAGLGSLAAVTPPRPAGLDRFLEPGPEAKLAAQQLGKALFWDTQVGSDGVACASCHPHAGADSRTKNQFHPGGDKQFDAALGPNAGVSASDFPFHRLADPGQMSFDTREVLRSLDDVLTSQGVTWGKYEGTSPGAATDRGMPEPDPVFSVGGSNVRRAEPRQSPSVINAVFNTTNFWDGRAHNLFNGATPFGPLDPNAQVWAALDGVLVPERIALPDSSLASQAVGPPTSMTEMSFFGRGLPDIGRKLLDRRPLAFQSVAPDDSLLAGLDTTYAELIRTAFRAEWWSGTGTAGGYRQIEANFSLFFGLAIQEYESLLVSDRTPFDRFMEGDDQALTPEQLRGLAIFVNRPGAPARPSLAGVGQGNCVSCHTGPELTAAAASDAALAEVAPVTDLAQGELHAGRATALADRGFANIGVRPTGEDRARGGTPDGSDLPLAFVRQALAGLPYAPGVPECGTEAGPSCPLAARTAVDGAFKIPGLRNAELTGPYFHNGGQATLMQVVEFYARRGDFGDVNIADLAAGMASITLTPADERPLVAFLLALTDERVRQEAAPFDHPQLTVPDGHPGDQSAVTCAVGIAACDRGLEIPAIGRQGRAAAGLPPLDTFLGLDPAAGTDRR